MKKKLLAALLVLVMLLSVMPLAAYAEDGDSSEVNGEILEEVQEDSEAPKESQTAETPASETLSTEPSKNDGDGDGGGDNAEPVAEDDTLEEGAGEPVVVSEGEEEDPTAEENSAIVSAEANATEPTCTSSDGIHYMHVTNISDETHTLTCEYCGYAVTDQHSKLGGTYCVICFYGCEHPEENRECRATSSTEHSVICGICNKVLESASHIMENDRCTVCGYHECIDVDHDCKCDICGVSHHVGTGGYDENEHWFACDYCDHETREAHYDNNGDGACDGCGYGCDHKSVHYEPYGYSYGYYGHDIKCDVCLHYLGYEAHTYGEDGTCTLCGFKPCDTHTFDESKTGWERHQCTECGYIEACIDANGDCKCDVCGEECHYLYDTADSLHYDSDEHWFTCGKCGKEYTRGAHSDYFNNETWVSGSDGLCDVCGYAMNGSGSSADDSGLDDVPKTGDASLALAGLSVLFAVCPILKKFVI